MASTTMPTKRIRLEQSVMPVSSEEELSIVTLKEQNKKLSNNYHHRMRIEQDLRNRIEQLEELVRKCEETVDPENQLSIVNETLKAKVEDLEYELNKSRLTEKRLADDLERLNGEFIELRKKTTSITLHHQATNHSSESIRHGSSAASTTNALNVNSSHCDQHQNQLSSQHQNQSHDQQGSRTSSSSSCNNLGNKLSTCGPLGMDGGNGIGTNATNGPFNSNSNYTRGDIIVPSSNVDENNLMLNQAKTIQDLDIRLSDQTELAKNRLKELEELNEKHREALIKIDTLQSEAKFLPKDAILNSADYRTLQSHFSVLYNEAKQLEQQLVESKTEIDSMKEKHQRQLQRLEAEGTNIQRELRAKILDLENCYSQARDEAEELKRETDRLEKANDSTLKLDTELKKSLNNYKIQIAQKNNDLQRLKRKLDEMAKKTENHSNTDAEKALMQDLDVTGQALDDMQDQNHRLLQQIEEKDEANFKLMSEHLKNNALQKHLNDEKIKLEEYGNALSNKVAGLEQYAARLDADRKLHMEFTRKLEAEISALKKQEDVNKKDKLQLSHQLSDLILERDKIAEQIDSIQKSISDKTALLTNESFKNKRLIEELDNIKKKYERASKMQSASAPDEVLMEEIKEYKKQLTCPSCKTKPKDAVLTKCFHVFCFDCLKTRVETRQRKCPKCNAQFGANDFHRLYLA